MNGLRGALATMGVIVAAGALGACGSDSGDSAATASNGSENGTQSAGSGDPGSGSRETGIGPLTGEAKQKAESAGAEAAKEAGGKTELPKGKKIGMLQVVGGIESADRGANAVKFMTKKLGYEYLYCDGEGVPTKQVACANTLLAQGADAIISTGVDPGTISAQIRKARSKNVPIIAVTGVQPPGYDASYGPNETEVGKVGADWFVKKLADAGGGKIAVSDFPTPTFHDRTVELQKLLKSNPDIKVVAKSQPDFANLTQGTQKTVTDQLTQYPDLKGMWFAFDTTGQAAGPVVASRYPGKSFPDKPLLITFHADLATVALIRRGAIDGAADTAYDTGAWVGMDQVLEALARGRKVDPDPQPSYPGVGKLYSYKMVTKDNLPPKGKYPAPEVDVVSFFLKKWQDEFGIPAS